MASSTRSIQEFFSPATAPPPFRDEGSSESDSTQYVECSKHDYEAKRLHTQARQSGFNKAWSSSFSWVVEIDGEGRLCRKHKSSTPEGCCGEDNLVDVPCVTMTQNSLRRHNMSLSHLEAKKLEAQLCISTKDGGLQQTFTVVERPERKGNESSQEVFVLAG